MVGGINEFLSVFMKGQSKWKEEWVGGEKEGGKENWREGRKEGGSSYIQIQMKTEMLSNHCLKSTAKKTRTFC